MLEFDILIKFKIMSNLLILLVQGSTFSNSIKPQDLLALDPEVLVRIRRRADHGLRVQRWVILSSHLNNNKIDYKKSINLYIQWP